MSGWIGDNKILGGSFLTTYICKQVVEIFLYYTNENFLEHVFLW
jgi:hypothetical protein